MASLENRTAKNKQKMKDSIKKAYTPVPHKHTGELELFKDIWTNRTHISFLSGMPIEFFNINCFAHCLPKGMNKYYKFKLYEKNIILLTEFEHFLFDNGTIESRARYQQEMVELGYPCEWQKVWDLRDKLKEEYSLIK